MPDSHLFLNHDKNNNNMNEQTFLSPHELGFVSVTFSSMCNYPQDSLLGRVERVHFRAHTVGQPDLSVMSSECGTLPSVYTLLSLLCPHLDQTSGTLGWPGFLITLDPFVNTSLIFKPKLKCHFLWDACDPDCTPTSLLTPIILPGVPIASSRQFTITDIWLVGCRQ